MYMPRYGRLLRGSITLAAVGGFVYAQQTRGAPAVSATQCDAPSKPEGALDPSKFKAFKLAKEEFISPNTKRYRFSLEDPEQTTGLNVASCLVAKAVVDGKTVIRPYTPVTLNEQTGYFDLVRAPVSPSPCLTLPGRQVLPRPLRCHVAVHGEPRGGGLPGDEG